MTNKNPSGSVTLVTMLVGASFRPPAAQLLAHVPAGAPLTLEPEPDNPYDDFAVKVLLDAQAVPESRRGVLDDELLNFATSHAELCAEGPRHVGYLASASGKPLKLAREQGFAYASNEEIVRRAAAEGGEVEAQLQFAPNGAPLVQVTITCKEQD